VIGFGLDVSHFQDPAALPWDSFQGHVDFVIVRASYGVTLDKRAREHIQRARAIGAKVGLYIYFRHEQNEQDQYVALARMSESCGIGTGDIVPAIDIEDDEIGHVAVNPTWSAPCESFVERACLNFGDCLVYISQRCWSLLGKPQWVLHRPLWVSHYRVQNPASPAGMPPTIWQHRVDLFDPSGPSSCPVPAPPNTIDQNRLLLPLPLVGYRPTLDDQERVRALVAETLRRGVQEADTDPPPDTERSV
jgi:GH25 family lysozyme M1 (1,4-beta-N-acetylmuramidase)